MKLPAFFKTQKFYSLFASVFNSAIALITLSLLARAITKEDFGHWAFFLTVYGFVEMALNGLIRTPVIRMAANDSEYRYAEVLSSAWDILIKAALACSVLVSLGFLVFSHIADDASYYKLAYWFPLYLIFSLPQVIGLWNANALMRFQRILLIRSIAVVIFLGGVFYVFLYGGELETIFWFYLISVACSSGFVLFRGWASFKCYLNSPKTYRKKILNFGKFSMGTTLSSTALGNSDSFIIIYFLGPEALALYEIPRRIKGLYDIPLRSVLQLSYPHFSKKLGKVNTKEFRKEFERVLGFSFLALMPMAVLIFLFSEFLVTILGGEEYAGAAIILRVFSLYLLISPLDRFSGVVLDVINRPNVNFNKVLVMLVVNVVGDILAIKLGFGLVGVAAVTTATVTAGIIYGFYMHRAVVPFRPFKLVEEGIVQSRIFVKSIF